MKTMPDDERKGWQTFWADVQKLLEEIKTPKP